MEGTRVRAIGPLAVWFCQCVYSEKGNRGVMDRDWIVDDMVTAYRVSFFTMSEFCYGQLIEILISLSVKSELDSGDGVGDEWQTARAHPCQQQTDNDEAATK